MCGIAGYFSFAQPCDMSSRLIAMSTEIRHRGPDDEGYTFANIDNDYIESYSSSRSPASIRTRLPQLTAAGVPPHHIGLAHVRYSIIDLSDGGHQPMWSACGQVCLTFNGEIYNYLELRKELSELGHSFRTGSDTEVLLTGYLAWGVQVLTKLNGFFAIALYDRKRRALLLARDRLGKAHLYFSRAIDKSIYWASEIKALFPVGCVNRSLIDTGAVTDFLLFGRRDHVGTFWREVEDFPPGHYVWLDKTEIWNPQRYWALPVSRLKITDLSAQEAAIGLRNILSEALKIRLRADVPIAFELSGGMDSSALVGLAAGLLREKFKTYTVEFPEAHSNEEPFARAVANRYPDQIDYHVIKPPQNNFWSEADEFVWLQEEPFHAPNLQTNQYLRRLLKQNGAHVVITGAAGDEMLAGYAGDYIRPYLRHLLSQSDYKNFYHELTSNNEISPTQSLIGLGKDALFSESTHVKLRYWRGGELRLLSEVIPGKMMSFLPRGPAGSDEKSFHGRTLANMTYRMMNYWLRSAAKSDYGIPIESRAPFLDFRVVEYCCQLPPEYLIHDGWHKHVLRMAVKDYLPEEVLWRRRKMGFPFPFREWLLESRSLVELNAQGIDCPYIDTQALFVSYNEFVKVAPITLWRLLSVILWWRRVIEQRPILT